MHVRSCMYGFVLFVFFQGSTYEDRIAALLSLYMDLLIAAAHVYVQL